MKLFNKEYDRKVVLYGGLIITFAILYLATAFVSFYHAITFFNIANAIWLSVILSFVAEIGQASVLFSILLTENKNKFLPWAIMIVLTSLQVIGNVVSSFDWIVAHGDAGLDGFKRSILFAVQTDDPEMFRIIVAWISGALLPVIALSMTALVAQNMDLRAKEQNDNVPDDGSTDESIPASDLIGEVSKARLTKDELIDLEDILSRKSPIGKPPIVDTSEETTKNEYDGGVPFDDPIYITTPISEPEEEPEPDDTEFGPVDSTNEIPDDLTETSTDETPSPDLIISHENGLVDNVIPKVIELQEKVKETPSIPKNELENLTEDDRLEKIRKIARENLKKK